VILDGNTKEKPVINYPCEWGFKLIGTNRDRLKRCISDIMDNREYKYRDGNISKNGKFISVNARCEVSSERERDDIFRAFQEHSDVKMVI
jgi:putative lipoic acid-binding regulatory protein